MLGRGRAAEAELSIEDVVDAGDDDLHRVAGVEPDPDPLGDRVELLQDGGLVDRRPSQLGDQERADSEIDLGLRTGDEPGEPGAAGRPPIVEA